MICSVEYWLSVVWWCLLLAKTFNVMNGIILSRLANCQIRHLAKHSGPSAWWLWMKTLIFPKGLCRYEWATLLTLSILSVSCKYSLISWHVWHCVYISWRHFWWTGKFELWKSGYLICLLYIKFKWHVRMKPSDKLGVIIYVVQMCDMYIGTNTVFVRRWNIINLPPDLSWQPYTVRESHYPPGNHHASHF